METVGDRLKRLRLEKGLSQRELTKTTKGVSDAYISRIESNEREPSIQAIRTIAQALGVNPVYLETGQMERCPHCGQEISVSRDETSIPGTTGRDEEVALSSESVQKEEEGEKS